MKVRKTLLFTGIALALGVSVNANAGLFSYPQDQNLLLNPDFEALLGGEWTASDAARVDVTNHTPAGTWSARMYQSPPDEGDMWQEVDISGCSPYGKGEWAAYAWYRIDGTDDVAALTIGFDGDPAWSPEDEGTTTWTSFFSDNNAIPADAMTARVTIAGEDAAVDGDDNANVYFDDIHFGVDCVTDFMKVSGKVRGTAQSPRGQYSFNGVFFNQESDDGGDDAQGSLYVNYKSEGFTCTFEAQEDGGDIFYNETDGFTYACVLTDYECEGTDAPEDDEAFVCVVLGEGGPNGNGQTKDRGEICILAEDSDVEILEADGDDPTNCANLDNGNTDLSMPPDQA